MADVQRILEESVKAQESGRLDEAERGYRQVLSAEPNHPDALHLLGLIMRQRGQLDVAIELVRRATAALPAFAPFHVNLGALLAERNDWQGAVGELNEALRLNPALPEVHNNLANALLRTGRIRDAVDGYRRAIALKADYPDALANLANALVKLGQIEEAEAAARSAVGLRPGVARYRLRLAQVLQKRPGAVEEARAAAQRAVELAMSGNDSRLRAEALRTLGDILHRMHRTQDALDAYEQAIADFPQSAEARCAAAGALQVQGFVADAIALYREALRISPGMVACHSNLLWALHSDPRCGAKELYDEHVAWARAHVAGMGEFVRHENDRDPDRKLRVGYVGGDFREHSTSRFHLPLLEHHDHANVEVFCYSTMQRPDRITERVRKVSDGWREVDTMGDSELVELIRSDRIDVLIDLAGHTGGNRLMAFAHKPAPVQASWLGWLGTTGLPQMEYWIADEVTVPPGEEKYFVERVYRLRAPFLCYGPPEDGPGVAEAPVFRNGFVTFGSFNNLGKLSAEVMESWGRILRVVEKSRLLLKAIVLEDERTRLKVRTLLARHGIPVERVDLMPPEMESRRHLEAYGRVDVGLDVFPFNGATTTAEALWMGVPVVTVVGKSHVSRVGASLVGSVGLGELCAKSVDEYVEVAAKLGNDVKQVVELRSTTRQRMQNSPLMDAKGFAAAMEAAYREMWRRWCGEMGKIKT